MNYELSIVCPIYNEELNLESFLAQMVAMISLLKKFSAHFILVNDGSDDRSQEIIEAWKLKLPPTVAVMHIVKHELNKGHNASLVSGLKQAIKLKSDVVITMDSDGEHPPEIIPRMLEVWLEKKEKIIHTVRRYDQSTDMFKTVFSSLFYSSISHLKNINFDNGMADFKLWDGKFLERIEEKLKDEKPLRILSVIESPESSRIFFKHILNRNKVSHFTLKKQLRFYLDCLRY